MSHLQAISKAYPAAIGMGFVTSNERPMQGTADEILPRFGRD